MVGLIVSGHGDWSNGILSAVNMISGPTAQLKAVPFYQGEGVQDLKKHYQKVIDCFPSETEILFLLDMYGGSPYNAAISLVYPKNDYDVITGVNLQLVLEALDMANNSSLGEVVRQLKHVAQGSFQIFSEEAVKLHQNDTFKEDEL